MQREFTPAAERVLAEASHWSHGDGSPDLAAPALILGLLAENECRAAMALAEHGIGQPEVCQRWSRLARQESAAALRLSADVEASLAAACVRLGGLPRPLMLATEHLLLGLVAAEHDCSLWLRQHGLAADTLEEQIYLQHGCSRDPLPFEETTVGPDVGRIGNPSDDQWVGNPSSNAADPLDGLAIRPTGKPTLVSSPILAGGTKSDELASCSSDPAQDPAPSAREWSQVLRVLDAAGNRASEGLRVVEDYVRFVLDDRHLTDQLKRLRHDLAGLLGRLALDDRLSARETQSDVGTALWTPSERRREDPAAVLTANFIRLQEALRSLEEFGKIVDVELAAGFKQLRYRCYTLQRSAELTRASLARLQRARLYVLIDGGPDERSLAALVRGLIDAGVHVLQLRDKRLDQRLLLQRARIVRQLTAGTDTLMVVNDRADLAALAQADGVHVGQDDLSVKEARSIVGPRALVGVSTHTIEQARRAVLDGANYLGVGPVFPSETKAFGHFPGVELLRAVAAQIRLPAFAIGGIGAENVGEVLAAGFQRIAVSGAITHAPDPFAAARELLRLVEASRPEQSG
jgi:thiamine-phosphate pyrophosphorylase